jgi:Secretion system C-terminal sorting domain
MKFILVLFLNFICFIGVSQVSLNRLEDGLPINNGDVLVFSELTDPESYLGLKISNSSNQDITIKIKVVSIENSDASNLQLCISPICVPGLVVGNSYPEDGSIIPANGRNGNFDHFINMNSGISIGQNVNYVFKLYIVNSNNVEIGNSITFTYRYSPNLATATFNELNAVGIQVKNTIATTSLNFVAVAPVTTTIYDVNGRVVASANTGSGNQSIDVSNLSAGIYIAQFTTLEGKKATVKFVKN